MALKFAKLTRPAIRALAPGGKIAEHGIVAERQANGDVRYSVNVMVDRQRIHRVVGRQSEGVTREQAERLIEKLRTEAREGRLNLPKGRKLHRGFSEAADDYLQRLRDTDGKNLKPKTQHLKNHLKPFFKDHRVDGFTDFNIRQYRKSRRTAGASIASVNRELATLRHLLKSAASWKWIKRDAIPEIVMEPEPQQPMVALNDAQSKALMDGAIADQDGRCWLFVAFGLGAAMRHREILRVRYDQIDFANRRVFIPEAKSGQREQPITQSLADALERQRSMEDEGKRDGWVFPTGNSKLSKSGHRTNMARQFARAVVRARLDPDKVTPHTMRRTAITKLVRAGVDLPTIQKISGHKTLAMVLRYVHMQGDHVDASISALDATLPGAVTRGLHTPAEPEQPQTGAIVAISAGRSVA
jgi:integrase